MAELKNAIVIQGEFKGGRTALIVQHMLYHNPDAIVILSTWATCDTRELESEAYDKDRSRLHVIKSALPNGPGSANRHMQRVSSHAGISLALEAGATHVLKMRSDQLLRRDRVCEFLHEKLMQYGQDRFVIGHGGTTLEEQWGKFHVGDFWMYGKIQHLAAWYDTAGIDTRQPCFREGLHISSAEPDFTQTWMAKMNITPPASFQELLREHFIILNCETVGLIHKTTPLDIPPHQLEQYWERYGDPKTIRHTGWLELLESVQP